MIDRLISLIIRENPMYIIPAQIWNANPQACNDNAMEGSLQHFYIILSATLLLIFSASECCFKSVVANYFLTKRRIADTATCYQKPY